MSELEGGVFRDLQKNVCQSCTHWCLLNIITIMRRWELMYGDERKKEEQPGPRPKHRAHLIDPIFHFTLISYRNGMDWLDPPPGGWGAGSGSPWSPVC